MKNKPLALTAALAASVCLSLGITSAATAEPVSSTSKVSAGAKLTVAPDAVAQGVTPAEALAATENDPQLHATLESMLAKLPAKWQQHRNQAVKKTGLEGNEWTDAISGAINPDDYECSNSPFNDWIDAEIDKIGLGDLLVLSLFGVLDYPTYDALFYETDATKQYFGRHGEYKNVLSNEFGKLQNFWDTKSFDIQLLAMHGNMLQDQDRVARMVTYFLGAEGQDAQDIAAELIGILEANPVLDDGEHPLFTLNAYAFTAEGDPDPAVEGLPDKIVMGDGILEAMEAIGLDQTSGKTILGHEYGHHVQYESNLFESDLTGPEATRRTELMADSFGTFFLVHKKGLAFNQKNYQKAQRLSYEVGDCSFDSPGHHGTPNQRMKASRWGYDQVQKLANPNTITPSKKLATKFDKALPKLVAPDA